MKISGRDIVVVGIQAWDLPIGSNCKNIALEFAKHNRVLYVNQPMDRFSRRVEKKTAKMIKRENVLKGIEPDLEQVNETFWVLNPRTVIESINRIPFTPVFDYLNRMNARRYSIQVLDAIKRLGFKDFILFNDSSMFLGSHLKEMLKPETYIYYIRDNLTKMPYWARHGVKIEPITIKKADVVTTNSIYYANYAKAFNEHSYMVGQGCDVSLYDDKINDIHVSGDLSEFSRPIIGYVGFLTTLRLEVNVISFIASEKPQWNIVLVGPEDEYFKKSELHKQNNIIFLGSRKPNDLPSYIKGFDVCINPQIVNDVTIGNYPRKIDEYLAMGKPTVATKTEAMEYFGNHVSLAENIHEWVKLIDYELNNDNIAKQELRRNFAGEHTWEKNVSEIYKALLKAGKL